MKKIYLGIILTFLSIAGFAQQGLDRIIVERYYVANTADNNADATLPVGAITYRIYVDLRTGWQLQSVYANPVRNQGMTFSTTAAAGFYNETGEGGSFSTDIRYSDLSTGTVMLDSWLSFGAAARTNVANNYFGVPKEFDNGVATIVHADGLLLNNDPRAGIPVSTQDGYLTVVTSPATIVPSATSTLDPLLAMLSGASTNNSFTTNDGAYFTSSTAVGPDSENRILIGQFTTAEAFTFKFNIQIRNITTLVVENHVAENPGAGDFINAALSQTVGLPATPPVVTGLTVNPGTVIVGEPVNFSVTATDNVSVSSVEFFRGTTSLGFSASSSNPYTLQWTSSAVGSFNITAVATDDEGTRTTSAPAVALTVNPVPANARPVINSFTGPSSVNLNQPVVLTANATDSDGTIAQVDFYTGTNPVPVTVTGAGPNFVFNTTAPATEGPVTYRAIATDNRGSASVERTLTVEITDPNGNPYRIPGQLVSCNGSDLFYIPVVTRQGSGAVENVIGFDMVMSYNSGLVKPTGLIRVNNDLVNAALTSYAVRIIDVPSSTNDSIRISLFLNDDAPLNTFFAGINTISRQVLAVEFVKTPSFMPNQTAVFGVSDFYESRITGITRKTVDAGNFVTFAETSFNGALKFWADNSPIYWDTDATSLETLIYGSSQAPSTAVRPDMQGAFTYDIVRGTYIQIRRYVNNDTSVFDVVNGYDAYMTQKVVIADPSFRPNVFQIIAMDVNQDGKVSAGDVSQILQRSVGALKEFRQAWNYTAAGVSNGERSNDWTFADNKSLDSLLSYRRSSTYPTDDGIGFSRSRVPQPSNASKASVFRLPVTYPFPGYACPEIRTEEYQGIMLGEVNGNYKNLGFAERPGLKKGTIAETTEELNSKVIFELSKSKIDDKYFTFPISVSSDNSVNSLDFALKFDETKLSFKDVSHSSKIESAVFYNHADKTLRFSSYSLQDYSFDAPVVTVRFEVKNSSIESSDLAVGKSLVNGDPAKVELSKLVLNEGGDMIKLYPNPAKDFLYVEVTENATIDLLDMHGRTIRTIKGVNAYEKREINLAGLAQGIYIMKIRMMIGDDEFVAIRKVIVKK